MVTSRIVALNGEDPANIKLKNFPHRMLQSIQLTHPPDRQDVPTPGETVTKGKWWNEAQAEDAAKHPLVAVNERQADRLGLKVGSTITFTVQDKRSLTPPSRRSLNSDGQHAYSRAEFILPAAVAGGIPGDLVRRRARGSG